MGEDGKQIGVVKTSEALAYAQERDLDLVEVAPDARPPVCRVLDYSKYKYEQAQKQKAARKHQQQITIREIKFRPEDRPERLRHQEGSRQALPARQGPGQGHDHVPRARGHPPRARHRAAGQARRRAGRHRGRRADPAPGRPQHDDDARALQGGAGRREGRQARRRGRQRHRQGRPNGRQNGKADAPDAPAASSETTAAGSPPLPASDGRRRPQRPRATASDEAAVRRGRRSGRGRRS